MHTDAALLDTDTLKAECRPGGTLLTMWGERIRHRRCTLGQSRKKLAAWCDTTEQTIGRIENGTHNPRDHMRIALGRALGCETGDIFEYPSFDEVALRFSSEEVAA